ncbi:SDR family NAD(P)-dependent oxidoreductase [Mycobacterium sp.]|uniref:SDR family NAD(P)-dependent oxidoreductase n=1 Tax=Mycobacterium sp. TaxID=1785 RepID=UPI0025D9E920|nr:SDR family NAD(P)-dependent oxidoreductase [Mycobacterium sp.]
MPQHCVITSGAGGIGLSAVNIIGRDQLVIICDLSQGRLDAAARELAALGIDCEPVVCDVTSRASVAALIDRSTASDTVASVIHTAGVSPSMGCASSKAGYLTGVDIACDGGVLAGMRLRDMITLAREA